jgi:hypothetical protein
MSSQDSRLGRVEDATLLMPPAEDRDLRQVFLWGMDKDGQCLLKSKHF